ncbi:OmpA family protein [Microbulbifer thermotolerans]|uniref:OmpA-like domain-containing protein n=1 Tax=Microbulbifer thermotolerans TaxID=252514 RepID=A0A143HPC8_MICTH|nr:OmpA family protein [Microbulbifer thermotolerans]AMX03573.1 hypothetical protein A3224_14190 [Microbulbifer thermotolerans]MCX2778200.1 OmpA family protein [Microbulbifer thermotolerans]MCX2795258.1 OmpA family protein [Microbulbifer thermotolerans]MCX2804548.1 OmpA family protein [Microbulbifer thermotolerans]
MADNLLKMALDHMGGDGVGALSNALGIPEEKGESAVETGLATVIAGMLNKGSNKTGMAGLFNMVTDSAGLDLSSITRVIGDPEQMESLQKRGGNMLAGLFGGKVDEVSDLMSSALGASGKGGSLLKIAAPVMMALLARLEKSKGLDISGMAALLAGQRQFIKGKLPSGLLQALNLGSFDELGEALETRGHAQPQEARAQAVHSAGKKRAGMAKWFWPLLIALAALYALNMCAKREKMDDQPGEVILDEESVLIEETPDATAVPPSGQPMDFAASFRAYLASTGRDPNREFPLDIQFAKGSAQVTSRALPDLEALVSIMRENPGLTIAIEGHTSGEGDEATNQQLSQERADVVTQMLVARGIDANRVTATGMGSAKPLAGEDTEKGKQQNRRISVRVVTFE